MPELEQSLRAVLEQMPAGVIVAEAPTGRLLLVNRRVGQFMPPEAIEASTVEECCRLSGFQRDGCPYEEAAWPLVRALREGAVVGEEEFDYRRSDGTLGTGLLSCSPIRDKRGATTSVIAALYDISERKQLEEELERHAVALSEANEAKDLFFNTLSHELRTPLAAMLNAVEVLKHSACTIADRDRALTIVERNVRHQTRLIDDLLQMSRLMRGKVTLDRERVDLCELVAAQVAAHEAMARRQCVTIAVESPRRVLPVCVDLARLNQVLANLLTNAIKFTEPGGGVKVSMSEEEDKAVVRVCDTGIGITAELLPCLFEPFWQGDLSLGRPQDGLGIGLSIARSLTELHGGTLAAASAGLGQGSEFTMRLPLVEGDLTFSSTKPLSRQAVPHRRVLIVEDNPDQRETLRLLLEVLGHAALTAANGMTALVMAERSKPDIALIDIGLPDIDGYEIARRLRRMARADRLRLVALTGYVTCEHRQRASDAGFDAYLAKPADLESLRRVLGS